MPCWSCQAEGARGAFCEACGAIQPPTEGEDLFAVLGVERRYHLDDADLERRFRELARRLHPDRYVKASPRERQLSLLRATSVNDAYRALRDPARRAEHLLALHGIGVGEAAGTARVEGGFLMQVLSLREELAEAQANGDAAKIEALAGRVARELAAAFDELSRAFAAWEEGELIGLARAQGVFGRLRFYERFLDEARGAPS